MDAKEENINHVLAICVRYEITLKDLIDAHIKNNGIIGVGLITLEEDLVKIVNAHYKKRA